jgi:hypothetical protein
MSQKIPRTADNIRRFSIELSAAERATSVEQEEKEISILRERLLQVLSLDEWGWIAIPRREVLAVFDALMTVAESVECSSCRDWLCGGLDDMAHDRLKQARALPGRPHGAR